MTINKKNGLRNQNEIFKNVKKAMKTIQMKYII